MYREIEFRAKSKLTKKWVYGNLIIKKTKQNVSTLENELYTYKYSIQYINKKRKIYNRRSIRRYNTAICWNRRIWKNI